MVFLITCIVAGCSQTSSTKTTTKPGNQNNSKPSAPTNSKITLNQDEMGTTDDPTQLTTLLSKVFKQRHENRAFKPGTIEVYLDVYLKAEPSTGIPEVLKMVDVIKEAGGYPVLVPMEISLEEAKGQKPDPLTLLVTIGERDPSLKVIVEGVELIKGPVVAHAEKDTLPKEFVVVRVPKDGEYVVGEKPVGQASLANELKSRSKDLTETKRVYLIVDGDGDVRYRSLSEVAYAAHSAGAKEIYIIMLKD
jgi:biopolymer transport protein ExbD